MGRITAKLAHLLRIPNLGTAAPEGRQRIAPGVSPHRYTHFLVPSEYPNDPSIVVARRCRIRPNTTRIESRAPSTLGIVGRNLRAENILMYNDVGVSPGFALWKRRALKGRNRKMLRTKAFRPCRGSSDTHPDRELTPR